MRTMETRRYEMLVKVSEFGETHRDRFPKSSVGGQAFAAVAAAVEQLSEHAMSKMHAIEEGKRSKAIAREALVERLDVIVRTARAIAKGSPGFDEPFRLPKRRQRSDQALLTAGRLFVKDAEAAKAPFIAHRIPKTFVADLHTLVETFAQAIRKREQGKDGHTAAQAGIGAALSSGLAAAGTLDVIVANEFGGEPMALAVWHRDRQIDRSRRPRSVAAAPPPAPIAAGTTPPGPPSSSSAAAPAPAVGEVAQPAGTDSKNDVVGVAS
jgi:hypothetical protein